MIGRVKDMVAYKFCQVIEEWNEENVWNLHWMCKDFYGRHNRETTLSDAQTN